MLFSSLLLFISIVSVAHGQESCATVTLTGTFAGPNMPQDSRASSTALISIGTTNSSFRGNCEPKINLLFDSGRGAVSRTAEAGITNPSQFDAVFLTHLHSDHITDLMDIAHVRWMMSTDATYTPLPVVASTALENFVTNLFVSMADEIAIRAAAAGRAILPSATLSSFAVPEELTMVWEDSENMGVKVSAIKATHGPESAGAVSYLIETPAGKIVYSGDTSASAFLDTVSANASLWVGEVLLEAVQEFLPPPIVASHILATEIGDMALRMGIEQVVLTHFIPTPGTDRLGNFVFDRVYEEEDFVDEVESAGFEGPVYTGRDLMQCYLPCDKKKCCEDYDSDSASVLTFGLLQVIALLAVHFF